MQPGFFLCLFHFPFYYYHLLFLTMPSHNFPLPVPQPPTPPARRGCWDVSRLASSFTPHFPLSCLCPPLNNTVSGKFPFPHPFRKRYQHPRVGSRSRKLLSPPVGLVGVETELCPPGRDLPAGASRPLGTTRRHHMGCSFRERLPAAPEASNSCQAALRCCSNIRQKTHPAIKS